MPINAVPTTVVLDREGKVAGRILGVVDPSTLRSMVDELVAEPARPPTRPRRRELVASAGDAFGQAIISGSLLLAIPVALLAGLVSFASPCVLPLVPGVPGLPRRDDRAPRARRPIGAPGAPRRSAAG